MSQFTSWEAKPEARQRRTRALYSRTGRREAGPARGCRQGHVLPSIGPTGSSRNKKHHNQSPQGKASSFGFPGQSQAVGSPPHALGVSTPIPQKAVPREERRSGLPAAQTQRNLGTRAIKGLSWEHPLFSLPWVLAMSWPSNA